MGGDPAAAAAASVVLGRRGDTHFHGRHRESRRSPQQRSQQRQHPQERGAQGGGSSYQGAARQIGGGIAGDWRSCPHGRGGSPGARVRWRHDGGWVCPGASTGGTTVIASAFSRRVTQASFAPGGQQGGATQSGTSAGALRCWRVGVLRCWGGLLGAWSWWGALFLVGRWNPHAGCGSPRGIGAVGLRGGRAWRCGEPLEFVADGGGGEPPGVRGGSYRSHRIPWGTKGGGEPPEFMTDGRCRRPGARGRKLPEPQGSEGRGGAWGAAGVRDGRKVPGAARACGRKPPEPQNPAGHEGCADFPGRSRRTPRGMKAAESRWSSWRTERRGAGGVRGRQDASRSRSRYSAVNATARSSSRDRSARARAARAPGTEPSACVSRPRAGAPVLPRARRSTSRAAI